VYGLMLRCNCGGRVEVVEGSDPDHGPQHWELYECQDCGAEGTYRFGPVKNETTGCLTIDESAEGSPV
jgi:hypothetical protein